jgi:galactokinase
MLDLPPFRNPSPGSFMDKARDLLAKFEGRFGARAAIYRAPGRVNLMGEHTDYNGGFVLPAAIGFSCWVAIAPREDRKLVLFSENFGESAEADLDDLNIRATGKWPDYPLGVAWALAETRNTGRGANLYISGEVPLGAGLSSSAAIEVSVGYALLDMSRCPIDLTQLALLCQRAENEFVGMRCGIMDQFTSCHGRAGHALLLDCRSLDFSLVPLPPRVHLVICNTMVRHELAASEYNARRSECEEGVRKLGEVLPGIRALRDVTFDQLEQHRGCLTDKVYRRCRHIITENERVHGAVSALQSGAISGLKQLMDDSHRSLRDDFEVSCRELDIMVEIAARQRGIYGARMTGGGFGGCTINLVDAAHSLEFQRQVAAGYQSATGLKPDIYVCEASRGAEAIHIGEPGELHRVHL